MKIVIDIDEKTYRRIQALVNADYFEHDICGYSMQRIANGTPLPEIYGRLGDLDELEQRISNFIEHDAHMLDEYTLIRERFILDGIKDTHTIIEANNAESEDKE